MSRIRRTRRKKNSRNNGRHRRSMKGGSPEKDAIKRILGITSDTPDDYNPKINLEEYYNKLLKIYTLYWLRKDNTFRQDLKQEFIGKKSWFRSRGIGRQKVYKILFSDLSILDNFQKDHTGIIRLQDILTDYRFGFRDAATDSSNADAGVASRPPNRPPPPIPDTDTKISSSAPEKFVDIKGDIYWSDPSTGDILWQKNSPSAAAAADDDAGVAGVGAYERPPPPQGPYPGDAADDDAAAANNDDQWIKYTDDASGRNYYHNAAINETVWDIPPAAAAAAAAPAIAPVYAPASGNHLSPTRIGLKHVAPILYKTKTDAHLATALASQQLKCKGDNPSFFETDLNIGPRSVCKNCSERLLFHEGYPPVKSTGGGTKSSRHHRSRRGENKKSRKGRKSRNVRKSRRSRHHRSHRHRHRHRR